MHSLREGRQLLLQQQSVRIPQNLGFLFSLFNIGLVQGVKRRELFFFFPFFFSFSFIFFDLSSSGTRL